MHAYLRPLPEKVDSDELKEIFPFYKKRLPLLFIKGPYNLSYVNTRVFRAAPRVDKVEAYIKWLDKIEKKKEGFWKDLGVFHLIQLSRQGPRYQKHMLLVALHFWNTSTNSLHLKCGMLTPTLLDVVAITGLKPIGEMFDPDNCESDFNFDFKRSTFGNYIEDHHNLDDEVSDEEHIAFLTFWLSIYVLCTRSIQVAKHYRTLAFQLHEGKQVCLSKLLLGCVYESLNQGATEMRNQDFFLIIPGLLWLFQLLLLATFRPNLDVFLPQDFQEAYKERSTEGVGLAMLRH